MNGLTSVVGIYDCSRVPATPGMTLGDTVDIENEEYEKLSGSYADKTPNYVGFKACQPQYQVPLESKLAESFFKHIAKKAHSNPALELSDFFDFRGPYGMVEVITAMGVRIPFEWLDAQVASK